MKYEFGGRIGNIVLILFLPLTVFYLYFCLRFNGGDLIPRQVTAEKMAAFGRSIVPTLRALWIYAAWFGFQVLLQRFVPGRTVYGRPLRDGTRLSYRMNGLASFLITLAVFWILVVTGLIDPRVVAGEIGALISVVTLFVFAFSIFLYLYGRKRRESGSSPPSDSIIHNFFMGYSHNPRIGEFDLKLFFEARPSLIGWIVLSCTFAAAQFQSAGRVTLPMTLVCAFQFMYVFDYFIHEEAILSTMDIVHDHFGFMLCFGDTAWVPFTYSIQAYYLMTHRHSLPVWAAVLFGLIFAAGYLFFRLTNLQKHRFREDPSRKIWGKTPEYIQTAEGGKLLFSGFWGWSRHFNYVGDILMAIAWSLPCLFGSLLPYFYPIYFTLLLVHRERRDFKRCGRKYGKDWDEYCRRVKWRILPGIY